MATNSNHLATNKVAKVATVYHCIICDYNTSRKYNWDKHLLTSKHNSGKTNNILATQNVAKVAKVVKETDKKYTCKNCNKEYCDKTGLWRHNKICTNVLEEPVIENKELFDKELVLSLVKQNAELLEIIKNGTNNTTNNTINSNVNSNNKTFNLQFFLNETCKDAMNISDFIESVKLQVSDLENVGKVGYIEGISNIIIKNLQALEVEKRPVHCADQKREVLYVKDANVWEKEDEANKKLRKAIRSIAHKNICMLKEFRDKYPDCEEYDSKRGSQYNKIVIEAMGGKGDNDYEKDTKIIKKIAKVVGIEKC
jgi:hypothetical protein